MLLLVVMAILLIAFSRNVPLITSWFVPDKRERENRAGILCSCTQAFSGSFVNKFWSKLLTSLG